MKSHGQLHVVRLAAFLRALPANPVHIEPQEAKLLDLLTARRGSILSKDELIVGLWGDRSDGGPEYARAIIGICVVHLRRAGYPVRTHHTRGLSLGLAA